MPFLNAKVQAEKLKAEGNDCYRRQKYAAATEKYTEAITLCPDMAVLYVNRALCHKQRQAWHAVMEDCHTALSLNRDSLKAHYLLGVGHREMHDYSQAAMHLQKALEAAREQGDKMKDEIWRELAKAKYAQWQLQAVQRQAEAEELRQKLLGYLALQRQRNEAVMSAAEAAAKHEAELAAWERVFSRAAEGTKSAEMPSAYTCNLTMEVFREPAITPHGQSYERTALVEHLHKVGKFDPVTRKPLQESEIVPNLGLRAATQHYLDEHPWGWAECI